MASGASVVTIDEVIEALGGIVDRAIAEGDRRGYFAALYRKVTIKVRDGIEQGLFDDGDRMRRLDVVFANRYLAALDGLRNQTPVTRCWQTALDATSGRSPLVLQHLLVGINAHINLDLGIAAARTAPGDKLPELRRDFDRINEILASQMAIVSECLGRISPRIAVLDWVGGRTDDELVRFSIEVARTQAWGFARELAPIPADQWGGPIGSRDAVVARLANRILRPGLLSAAVVLIRARENDDVAHNIRVLADLPEPDLQVVEARVRDERRPDR